MNIANLFRAAVVDDMFEKIRLQMVDFDGSGRIDLAIKDANGTIVGGDFVEFFEVAAAALAMGGNVAELERYDLNGDGKFVYEESLGSGNYRIDNEDIVRLVKIFATQFGDADLDYLFDTADFVAVFTADEYEDSITDNSTWLEGDWDGDFEFDTADFVFAFQGGGYEAGYADRDGDGHIDVLPVWAWHITFVGSVSFYMPSWG